MSYPVSVPWELVSGHEAQAVTNHGQSLETLARRGGLHPVELYLVCHDKPLRDWRQTFESTVFAWFHDLEGVEWKA